MIEPMFKARIAGALFIAFFLIAFSFATVHAQDQDPQFTGDTGVAGIVPCGDKRPCGACDLAALGQDIVNFAVFLSVFVATVMFVVAGFMYVFAAGDEGKIKKAHAIFRAVVIGLIIVLTAWLTVDIIMSTFLNKKFGPWNTLVCIEELQVTSPEGVLPVQRDSGPDEVLRGTGPEEVLEVGGSEEVDRQYRFEIVNSDGQRIHFFYPTLVQCQRALQNFLPEDEGIRVTRFCQRQE